MEPGDKASWKLKESPTRTWRKGQPEAEEKASQNLEKRPAGSWRKGQQEADKHLVWKTKTGKLLLTTSDTVLLLYFMDPIYEMKNITKCKNNSSAVAVTENYFD